MSEVLRHYIFSPLFILLLIWMIVHASQITLEHHRLDTYWQKTSGIIMESSRSTDHSGNGSRDYFRFVYNYSINTTTHSGIYTHTALLFGPSDWTHEYFYRKYPAGSKIVVQFDPQNISQSTLKMPRWPDYAVIIFLITVLIISVYSFLESIRKPHAA